MISSRSFMRHSINHLCVVIFEDKMKILLKGFSHNNRLIYETLRNDSEITVDTSYDNIVWTDSEDIPIETFDYVFSEFPIETDYKMISYVSEETDVEILLKWFNSWSRQRCHLVGVAKNEEKYIEDWCLWYFRMGIDRIAIYDNNDDSKKGVLENLLRNSLKLKSFRDRIEVIPWKGCQDGAYYDYWKTHDFDWLTINDVDEFIDLNNSASNIKELLKRYDSKRILSLKCLEYGDNGIIERSEEDELKPVWEVFTSMNWNNYENFFKCSFNKNLITEFITLNGHFLRALPYKYLTIDWTYKFRNKAIFKHFNKPCFREPFIRHFRTYSLKEYCQQKLNVRHQFGVDIRRCLLSQYYYQINRRTPEKDEFARNWRKEHSQNYLIVTTMNSFKEFFNKTFCYIIGNSDTKIAKMKSNFKFGGWWNLLMILEEMDYVIFIQE